MMAATEPPPRTDRHPRHHHGDSATDRSAASDRDQTGRTIQHRPYAAQRRRLRCVHSPSQEDLHLMVREPSPSKELHRVTFQTSREMDFFTERELVTQTGHGKDEWPLVIVKELMDNALDACEEAGIAPTIDVSADPCGITIRDNGPGLPEK